MLTEAASLVSRADRAVGARRPGGAPRRGAELTALRAQISPHFIYNALAAIAGNIHARSGEQAREQLIDFADFTRYLFGDARADVTLDEEIEHVHRYVRLEQARFPDALSVSVIDVSEEVARRARADAVRCSRWSRTRSGTGSGRTPACGTIRGPGAVRPATTDRDPGGATTAAGSSRAGSRDCWLGRGRERSAVRVGQRESGSGQRRRPAARDVRGGLRPADRERCGQRHDRRHPHPPRAACSWPPMPEMARR